MRKIKKHKQIPQMCTDQFAEMTDILWAFTGWYLSRELNSKLDAALRWNKYPSMADYLFEELVKDDL